MSFTNSLKLASARLTCLNPKLIILKKLPKYIGSAGIPLAGGSSKKGRWLGRIDGRLEWTVARTVGRPEGQGDDWPVGWTVGLTLGRLIGQTVRDRQWSLYHCGCQCLRLSLALPCVSASLHLSVSTTLTPSILCSLPLSIDNN